MTRRGRITVLAGVNGAGKSSLLGAAIRASKGAYYNPDEFARAYLRADPRATLAEANAHAWEAGRAQLVHAIAQGDDFAFETTLGGQTITRLLGDAVTAGLEVYVRYVGLDGPERHIARVRARVAAGGHDIPEEKIRERYRTSLRNVIALLPRLTQLWVYDNSTEAAPQAGQAPQPQLLFRVQDGLLHDAFQDDQIPEWAHPILRAARSSDRRSRVRDSLVELPPAAPMLGDLSPPPEASKMFRRPPDDSETHTRKK